MTLNDLQCKKIAILGLGLENQALVDFLLAKKIDCALTICDARLAPALGEKYQALAKHKNISWQLGPTYNQNLEVFDVLFRSPGWPLACPGVQLARRAKKIVSSPMKLFFDLCPTKNIIGVTGSKGKGTTSSLITAMLKAGNPPSPGPRRAKRVWLGGNIGVAPFAFINKLKPGDWVVLELSSFQLEDLPASPRIAVLTNFTPEHLAPADPNNPNYHSGLAKYWQAKLNIAVHQTAGGLFIVNEKLKNKIEKLCAQKILTGKIKYFTKSDLPSRLPGEHNKENIAAAALAAAAAGVDAKAILQAVAKFKGLEHRLEFVKTVAQIKYYDDSFATTPESTMIALQSFAAPIILLAGGADKRADFSALAKLIKQKVKLVCLLSGAGTPALKKCLLAAGINKKQLPEFDNLKAAMSAARASAAAGNIILLSTAGASFGMFKNYKERGNQFKEIVNTMNKLNANTTNATNVSS